MSTPKFPIREVQLLCMYCSLLDILQIMCNLIAKYMLTFIPADQHEFLVPKKGIKVPTDIAIWQKSEAYFVRQLL